MAGFRLWSGSLGADPGQLGGAGSQKNADPTQRKPTVYPTEAQPLAHNCRVKTQDPTQDLADGVDLSANPELAPLRTPLTPRPRLCEAGPCRHYHRLEIQMDAQAPLSVRVPSGGASEPYQPPPTWHVQVSHYCYPSPGIEMPLGALPVVACNRWRPIFGVTNTQRAQESFEVSQAGQDYQATVAQWEADQLRLSQEAHEAEVRAEALAADDEARACRERWELDLKDALVTVNRLVECLAGGADPQSMQGARSRSENRLDWLLRNLPVGAQDNSFYRVQAAIKALHDAFTPKETP